MTPELDRYFLGGGPVHINADFPEKRAPDAKWTQLGSRPVVRAVQLSAHGGQRGVGWGSIRSSGGIREITGASLTVFCSKQ